MNNNVYEMVLDLKNTCYDNGDTNARLGVLHNFVDAEDINSAEKDYRNSSIDTDTIRMIFGWGKSPRAIQIRERREAEKNNDAGTDK